MKRKKSLRMKILSVILALTLCLAFMPMTAFADMPEGTAGEVWDGVDFDELMADGNSVYYGTYDHAATLANTSYGAATSWEGAARPILWNVTGEEADSGAVTLLSKYVLDSQVFNTEYRGGGAQNYATSDIHTWLNGTFLSSFAAAELSGMADVNTITGMYDWSSGDQITGHHYPQYAYKDGGEYLSDNHTSQQVNTGPWPKETNSDKVYLPWGKYDDDTVYWTAGNEAVSEGLLAPDYTGNIATLKNSTAVYWWLRSPYSHYSYLALCAAPSGFISTGNVDSPLGVRPAFKLNLESVIFTSEILDDVTGRPDATLADANYAAGAGAKNFKLTVLNSALTLSSLSDIDGVITDGATRAIAEGGSLALTATVGSAGEDSLAYKIVDRDTGAIEGYGTEASTTDITVDASDLAEGGYTVYVWAQKSNTINSHEGSQPVYFTLTVDGTAPALSQVSSARTGAADATVTFTSSEAGTYYYQLDSTLPTAASLVAGGTNSAALNAGEQTIDINLSILTAGAHTIYIAAKDAAGNVSELLTDTIPAYSSDSGGAFGYGEVWDGVDFDELMADGSGVYYGTYDHATALANTSYGAATSWEGAARPILWNVTGEEADSGAVTLLSKYVLDSQVFNTEYRGGGAQNYATSDIHTWLNGTFLSSFAAAELSGMADVNTITGMYDWSSGDQITGDHYPQYAYKDGGEYLSDNHTSQQVNTGPWPKETNSDKVYLPWGKYFDDTVYWTAGNEAVSEGLLAPDYTGNAATLKNSTAVYWWLRSPYSGNSRNALCAAPSGYLNADLVGAPLGVRPAFKINPASVIFASEILDDVTEQPDATQADGTNYVEAAGGAKNFKLTVLNPSLTLYSLSDSNGTITDGATRTIAEGGSLALNATVGTSGENALAYKIVESSRALVGYGTAASTADITVDASALADGDYTVYVWAQKSNTINSHEGSQPVYFTLTVDGTAPTVSQVSSARTSAADATVIFRSDEAGEYYYQLVADGAADPSIDTTGAGTAVAADTDTTITLDSIPDDDARDLWIYVKDTAGNVGKLKIDIAAYSPLDTTPPALTIGTVSRTSAANAAVTFTSSEAGTYYYQLDGAAPTASSLVAGGTNAAVLNAAAQTVNLSSLTAGTRTIYIAAEDAAGNVSNLLTTTIPAYSSGGSSRGGGSSSTSGSISQKTADYDLTAGGEVSVTLAKGNYSLNEIVYDGDPLKEGGDYTVNGTKYTFTEEFLNGLKAGTHKITFDMSSGDDPVLTITVKDETSVPETEPEPVREPEPGPDIWSNPFTDVREADWFYSDVRYVHENQLFAGTSVDTFSPDTSMTRGMIVTVLGRLYGANTGTYSSSSFSDVQAGQYYAPYIEWAKQNGIVSGVGDNRFAPDAQISRQDLAVIITNYARFAGKQFPVTLQYQTFADESGIAGYAKNAVQTLYGGGIITGKGSNVFDPNGSATRAEVASMLHRFIEAAN